MRACKLVGEKYRSCAGVKITEYSLPLTPREEQINHDRQYKYLKPKKRKATTSPVSILYKSIAGRYRPVRVADGPITARYRFIKNASWVLRSLITMPRLICSNETTKEHIPSSFHQRAVSPRCHMSLQI